MKRIEILFNEESGEVKIEAFGYRGKSCKEATKFLEDALGTEEDTQYKAEYMLRISDFVQKWEKETGTKITEGPCG